MPFAVVAEVTGYDADEVHIMARAYLPPELSSRSASLQPPPAASSRPRAASMTSGGLMPFELLFPELAQAELGSLELNRRREPNGRRSRNRRREPDRRREPNGEFRGSGNGRRLRDPGQERDLHCTAFCCHRGRRIESFGRDLHHRVLTDGRRLG